MYYEVVWIVWLHMYVPSPDTSVFWMHIAPRPREMSAFCNSHQSDELGSTTTTFTWIYFRQWIAFVGPHSRILTSLVKTMVCCHRSITFACACPLLVDLLLQLTEHCRPVIKYVSSLFLLFVIYLIVIIMLWAVMNLGVSSWMLLL